MQLTFTLKRKTEQSRLGGKTRRSVWDMLSLKCVLLTWRCQKIQECGIFRVWTGDIIWEPAVNK